MTAFRNLLKTANSWRSGTTGSGDGQYALGIDLDSAGNVYIADWRNDRIQSLARMASFDEVWQVWLGRGRAQCPPVLRWIAMG